MTQQFIVHAQNDRIATDAANLDRVCAELVERHGRIDRVEPVAESKAVSEFGRGRQVVDHEAKARIEGQHSALAAGGVAVDAGRQLYATGTRMAKIGYDNQAERKREHEQKQIAVEAAAELAARVISERREDVELSAGELADKITTNGKLRAAGFHLREQAIRGLFARLEGEDGQRSPALGYVLGLRDRIVTELGRPVAERDERLLSADKAKLADVLAHECRRYPDATLKLRTRGALGDCFAIVSPSYSNADAPEVLPQLLDAMPRDARATWSYDPATTQWEIRAHVWTPTPVEEQAVGEAFEGYTSIRSRDNGTGGLEGGGGIILLACLNAGTYVAESASTKRRHLGQVIVDAKKIIREATGAIAVVCQAWGAAREQVVEVPTGIKLTDVIPDFWSSMLTQREYAFAGILRGRSKEHAQKLSATYFEQRRDRERVVAADMAQAWTRYVQDQEPDVRRQAEAAAGAWLVGGARLPKTTLQPAS